MRRTTGRSGRRGWAPNRSCRAMRRCCLWCRSATCRHSRRPGWRRASWCRAAHNRGGRVGGRHGWRGWAGGRAGGRVGGWAVGWVGGRCMATHVRVLMLDTTGPDGSAHLAHLPGAAVVLGAAGLRLLAAVVQLAVWAVPAHGGGLGGGRGLGADAVSDACGADRWRGGGGGGGGNHAPNARRHTGCMGLLLPLGVGRGGRGRRIGTAGAARTTLPAASLSPQHVSNETCGQKVHWAVEGSLQEESIPMSPV